MCPLSDVGLSFPYRSIISVAYASVFFLYFFLMFAHESTIFSYAVFKTTKRNDFEECLCTYPSAFLHSSTSMTKSTENKKTKRSIA